MTLATAFTFWPIVVGLLAGIPTVDVRTKSPSRFWADIWTGDGAAEAIGLAVVTAWLTLLLTRGWHPEPTWIDRLGRILGACWVVLFVACVMLRAGWILRS